ncbi:ABC transporter transmembrane domain-containing protein [Anaerobacillus sp. MEB173]|uniref:ABC transporter transmembrane domain-containing protein n=1 Tax=Anaerobacillus sp. MEB173 TaxID=3383345 RepID=UPI003F907AA0
MKIFIDLLWYFKQEKLRYGTGIIILAFVSLFSLLPPYIVGVIVDHIEQRTITTSIVYKWISILFLVAVTVYVLRYLWRIMIFGASIRLARLLRNRLYDHFTKMSANFYQRRRIGDLMAHSTNDIRAIEQTAGFGVLTLVDSITMGSFVVITMAVTISWKLTLIALIPMPLMALATSYYGSLLHKRFSQAQASFSNLNDKVHESMSGIRVTKAFGYENEEVESFRQQSEDVVQKNIAVAKIDALFDPTISLIVGFSFFLSIFFGAKFVIAEELSIGQLTSFTIYLGMLIWPLLAFGWLFNIVERGRASYNRVSTLLAEKQDIKDDFDTVEELPNGDVSYQIRSFSYEGSREPSLRNIEFSLKQGSTLGIVGKTGSGKTTLVKLLLREHDIDEGKILIGDISINKFPLDKLRSKIGYIPQDHFLFSATIADNIAFAKQDATFNDIKEAAELAAIHKDILRFPQGYETIVGERGVTLSGGQKQRISIARALIIDPDILIFDDSLSAVDAKTEEQILRSLKENRKGKTTIITAHRLSSVKEADLILVLEQGEIIERGNHDELLLLNGWYKSMYDKQQLQSLIEEGSNRHGEN